MTCWLVLLLLVVLVWRVWTWQYCHHLDRTAVTATVQRLLKPRTPDDCPACRQPTLAPLDPTSLHPSVMPWREGKSRRGAPKRIATQGFACPNRVCTYYGIIDAQIHALVGDGAQGRHERIQTFRCQACGTTFSARRQPMHRVGRRVHQWQVAAGLVYAQVKKTYRRRKLVRVTAVMRCGTREQLQRTLQGLGLSGRLNTAFVERINLTLRQSVAALVRRTWSTLQGAPQLLVHLEWWRAYYHFVRPHETLRVTLVQPIARGGKRQRQRYRQRTPAMAAGLTSRRWTVHDLLALPLPPKPIGAA